MKIFQFEKNNCQEFIERFDKTDDFVANFRNEFDSVIAYHATKLSYTEVENIENNGLLLPSKDFLIKKALDRFVENDAISKEVEQFIKNHFASNYPYPKNELNFGFYRDDLVKRNYQYLLLGSEGLLVLADELKKIFKTSFRERMYQFGKPYIISVSVKTQTIENDWIEGIYEYWMNGCFDTSLVLNVPVKPQSIVQIQEVDEPTNVYNIPLY